MRKNRNFPAGYPIRLALLGLLSGMGVSAFGQTSVDQTAGAEKNRVDRVQTSAVTKAKASKIFGWREKIILSPELQWKLDAKLDTGADTSSLDAVKIRRVRFQGKSYVRFSIRNPESGELVSLRRPYVRTVRIRQHDGDHQRRYVVLMEVCLGSAERMIEVTLTDRELFDYPVLLGRSALAGLAVVDSMATYTTKPHCRENFSLDSERVEESSQQSPEDKKSVSKSSALVLESLIQRNRVRRVVAGFGYVYALTSGRQLTGRVAKIPSLNTRTTHTFPSDAVICDPKLLNKFLLPLSCDQYVCT